jgi:lysophospholipase L1-like esterase
MKREQKTERPTLSWKKRLLFWLIILAVPLLALEVGLRVYYSFQLGPSILFYGTSLNREKSGDAHSGDMNLREGYFKYHPHEERFTRDHETGKLIRVTINGEGFRGPDFDEYKDPGVIRVVTLGASSTFGFSDHDDETYPYYLEQLLNRQPFDHDRFEVINFGIPHLESGQILALFEAEALPLHPDVITYYEGVNDTWSSPVLFKKEIASTGVVRKKLARSPAPRRVFWWVRDHFIAVSIADAFVKSHRHMAFTEADYQEHLRGKPENYLANVSAIYHECKDRHILFIVASQQAKSFIVGRKDIRGVTYRDENKLVRQKLARDGYIDRWEMDFLTHGVLMDDLEAWAKANDVPYVDTIAAMDQHRDCLVSWVHLNAEGNRIIAESLAAEVQRDLTLASHPRTQPAPH